MSPVASDSGTGAGAEGAGVAIAATDTGTAVEHVSFVNPFLEASATTLRLYARLPHVYRDADATAGIAPNDYPLLRWLSCLVDQAGEMEVLLNRFNPPGPGPVHSDLADPVNADAAWLPWLAQLLGVALASPLQPPAVAAARASIAGAAGGWQSGTRAAIVSAVRPVLSGGQSCLVLDHYGANAWQIEVRTRNSETPGGSPDPVLAAITAANAKPAGFVIVHTTYEATWDTIAAHYATWDTVPWISWDSLADTQP